MLCSRGLGGAFSLAWPSATRAPIERGRGAVTAGGAPLLILLSTGCAASAAAPTLLDRVRATVPEPLPRATQCVAGLAAVWGRYALDTPRRRFAGPGGRVLGYGGDTLVVWDVAGGAEERRIALPVGSAMDASHTLLGVSPDGRTAYLQGPGHRVSAWDLNEGTSRTVFEDPDPLVSLTVLDDGTLLAYAYTAPQQGPDNSLFHQGSGAERGGDLLWHDPETGATERQLHVGGVNLLAIDGSGTTAWVREDHVLRAYALPDWNPRWSYDGDVSAARSDGGALLVTLANAVVELDPATGTEIKRFVHPRHAWRWPSVFDVSPDGALLLIGDGTEVRLFDRASAAMREAPARAPTGEWAPDGSVILGTDLYGKADLWNTLGTERVPGEWPGHRRGVEGISLSADGKRAITWPGQGDVLVWNVAEGELVARHRVTADDAALSPDGRRIAIDDDVGTRLIDADTGEEIWSRPASAGRFTPVFSPDGRSLLVAAPRDGTARLDARTGATSWRVATRRPLWSGATWSPDGKQVVLSGDASAADLQIVNAATGRIQRRIATDDAWTSPLGWFADGGLLASGRHRAVVYDTIAGTVRHDLGEDRPVAAGETLYAVASFAGRVRVLAQGDHAVRLDVDLACVPDRPTSLAFTRGDQDLLVGTARGVVLRLPIH